MLAHELRNPLAPISNAVRALRVGHGDAKVAHAALGMFERQVGQLARLVDDLLDLSRITRGKIELRKEPVELLPIVEQAVEAARARYGSLDHELTVTLPTQPVYLSADPARLAQVIGNLLNNACKFTDPGGHIGLTVDARRRAGGRSRAGQRHRHRAPSSFPTSSRCSRRRTRPWNARVTGWASA